MDGFTLLLALVFVDGIDIYNVIHCDWISGPPSRKEGERFPQGPKSSTVVALRKYFFKVRNIPYLH